MPIFSHLIPIFSFYSHVFYEFDALNSYYCNLIMYGIYAYSKLSLKILPRLFVYLYKLIYFGIKYDPDKILERFWRFSQL